MRRLRAAAFCLACVLGAGESGARSQKLSGYEKESIRLALEEVDAEEDPKPVGKLIEGIDVVALEVFEKRDPLPGFVNFFHTTTRTGVIKREILLGPGDRWDQKLVEETERNLRVRQLSVVLIVATKGSAPDRVRLLAVVKDVWTLRVNFEPVLVNWKFQSLYFQPAEENFLGLHKTLNSSIYMTPSTYSVGLGFVDPRVAGSRIRAAGQMSLVFNCRTDDLQGSTGSLFYGKPLYSTRTRWGWAAVVTWQDRIYQPSGTVGQSVCSGGQAIPLDFLSTRKIETVPYEYRMDVLDSQFSATRSYGELHKQNLSFGMEASRNAYEPPDLSREAPVVRREFREELLPTTNQRLSPFVQLHAFENRYHRVLDLETLALQEDFLLGYDAWARLYPAHADVGSSRTFLGTYAGLGYTVPLADGLARVYGSSTAEIANAEQTDVLVTAGLRAVTPRLPFGRFVLDGVVNDRVVNYLNLPAPALGGTTRLRGYQPSAFVGLHRVVSNFEFRSRPIEILSVEIGAALFYDVGDAFSDWDELTLHHGVGGGLRFVFPQVQREVFRVDVGFPVGPHDPRGEATVVAQFYQAFTMPTLTSPALYP